MRILMVASECAPFAKTGGLADVVSALPRALARLGHAVDVVIPRYRGITQGRLADRLEVAIGGSRVQADVYTLESAGVRHVFVEHPSYFDREHLYGSSSSDYPDNAERFAFLARAAVAWMTAAAVRYDAVHAHDWQAGLVPIFLRDAPAPPPRTVFTIHNLAYQGLFDAEWLPRIGLSPEMMSAGALEYWGRISFLKAGVVFSRSITTVSPRYAWEIQTPEFGFGFDGILKGRSGDLVGILNGIDYDEWDPARDRHLPVPYDASTLEGKKAAKQRLIELAGLTDDGRPLVGMVSRLVDQKGFDLLAELAETLPGLEASFVLLGTGERRYEEIWRNLANRYPERIAARISFDEPMAHLIEGGADIFLMPSRFEPCGLNQMYSLRYGTVPVVRATGGLYDTVRDFDPVTGLGNGFRFDDYSATALLDALTRALRLYQDRDAWRRLQVSGMQEDHSWESSARQYVAVYGGTYN